MRNLRVNEEKFSLTVVEMLFINDFPAVYEKENLNHLKKILGKFLGKNKKLMF